MTCIVGVRWKGGVVLGGDSAAGGSRVMVREEPKVFRLEQTVAKGRHRQEQELVAGYTTSFRMGQLLQHRLELPYHPEEMDAHEWMVTRFVDAVRETLGEGGWLRKSDEREHAGTFLVGYRGELFRVDSDLQVGQLREYAACGSGETVALGALHVTRNDHGRTRAHARVRTALEAAAEHDAWVRPPWRLEEVRT